MRQALRGRGFKRSQGIQRWTRQLRRGQPRWGVQSRSLLVLGTMTTGFRGGRGAARRQGARGRHGETTRLQIVRRSRRRGFTGRSVLMAGANLAQVRHHLCSRLDFQRQRAREISRRLQGIKGSWARWPGSWRCLSAWGSPREGSQRVQARRRRSTIGLKVIGGQGVY